MNKVGMKFADTSDAFKYLLAIGAGGMIIAWSLFFRMLVMLNSILPRENRIPPIYFRYHVGEVIRRHQEHFPKSRLAAAWLVLLILSGAAISIAIIVEIRPHG